MRLPAEINKIRKGGPCAWFLDWGWRGLGITNFHSLLFAVPCLRILYSQSKSGLFLSELLWVLKIFSSNMSTLDREASKMYNEALEVLATLFSELKFFSKVIIPLKKQCSFNSFSHSLSLYPFDTYRTFF